MIAKRVVATLATAALCASTVVVPVASAAESQASDADTQTSSDLAQRIEQLAEPAIYNLKQGIEAANSKLASVSDEAKELLEKYGITSSDQSTTNAIYWRDLLTKYRHNNKVKQVMMVRYTGGSNAVVQYYVKKTKQGDAWVLKFSDNAYIGKNGIGKTQEGDAKTPTGDFKAKQAFGILKNPGTSLKYIKVKKTTYACDEDGPYYNQIIDTKKTGHECTGEAMYEISPEYNYGLVLNYNASNTYPNGSAIFLHCKGAKPYTGGCIAISQKHMKAVLKTASKGMRVVIAEN